MNIVIIGAGGFAREVYDVIYACNQQERQYTFLGYLDDNQHLWNTLINGNMVLGGLDWAKTHRDVKYICGIGNPTIRKQIIECYKDLGLTFFTVIHPRATLTPLVSIGTGCVITAGCVITNSITIGDHVHINLNTTIGHDAIIDSFGTFNPGVHISGNVHVGEGCELGTGCCVIQGISIGDWTTVGAGAVVVRDLPEYVTAVGVPAKVIKQLDKGETGLK